MKNAFIFCNRKRDVDVLAKWLERRGHSAKPMHGDLDQKQRTQTLQAFKEGKIVLLVCSDVAGRGIDIDDVSHVFNYNVPFNADDYVHRIGRTGRAGKTGHAYTLATRDEEKLVDAIEKLIKQKIPVFEIPGAKSDRGETPQESRSSNGHHGRGDKPRDQQPSKQKFNSQPSPTPFYGDSQKPKKPNENERKEGSRGFGDDVPGFFSKSR